MINTNEDMAENSELVNIVRENDLVDIIPTYDFLVMNAPIFKDGTTRLC